MANKKVAYMKPESHRSQSYRICITVPKRVKKLMLNYQESNEVNWSKIASRAFLRKIKGKENEKVERTGDRNRPKYAPSN